MTITYADGALSDRIYDFLRRDHRGHENAMSYKNIREHFALPDDGNGNHAFRLIVTALPVCTAWSGWPMGVFIPRTAAELAEFKRELYQNMAGSKATARYERVEKAYPELVRPKSAGVQLTFPMEGA